DTCGRCKCEARWWAVLSEQVANTCGARGVEDGVLTVEARRGRVAQLEERARECDRAGDTLRGLIGRDLQVVRNRAAHRPNERNPAEVAGRPAQHREEKVMALAEVRSLMLDDRGDLTLAECEERASRQDNAALIARK